MEAFSAEANEDMVPSQRAGSTLQYFSRDDSSSLKRKVLIAVIQIAFFVAVNSMIGQIGYITYYITLHTI